MLIIRLIFMFAVFLVVAPVSQADAAEAIMPVKARIVRCVSFEERSAMCHSENLCCNLLDSTVTTEAEEKATIPDMPAMRSNRSISYSGPALLAIE